MEHQQLSGSSEVLVPSAAAEEALDACSSVQHCPACTQLYAYSCSEVTQKLLGIFKIKKWKNCTDAAEVLLPCYYLQSVVTVSLQLRVAMLVCSVRAPS